MFDTIFNFTDEKSAESRAVLDKLENIDSETDNLDITFVKMQDPRYARKWGVTKLPAIVYFRKRFPSIYRGKQNFANVCSDIMLMDVGTRGLIAILAVFLVSLQVGTIQEPNIELRSIGMTTKS